MRRSLWVIALLAALAANWQNALAQTSDPPDEPATIHISQVDASSYPQITLYVRILDENGERVPDLEQDDFNVIEDGKEVVITAFQGANLSPITTSLLIDVSGSMDDEGKLAGAQEAALTFIDLMRQDDTANLIVFDDEVFELVGFTTQHELLKDAVEDLDANGGTAWYDAVKKSAEEITEISGRKSIILLSDGLDNDSWTSFNGAVTAAEKAGAPVYPIGLGRIDFDNQALSDMALQTGGEYFQSPSASDLEEIYRKISEQTLEEYVITYTSPRPNYDGTRRDIQVNVGSTTGGGKYTEEHLLTIESDPLIGLVLFVLLLAAAAVPYLASRLRRKPAHVSESKEGETVVPDAPDRDISMDETIIMADGTGGVALDDKCPSCGAPLGVNVKFCRKCGYRKAGDWNNQLPRSSSPAVFPPSQLACPHCGAKLRAAARFCSSCSKPVASVTAAPLEAAQCVHCKTPLRPGARFCAHCGKQVV